MSTPARTTITAGLGIVLRAVTALNGYRTNIGETVIIGGERKANPDELPCCILAPGDEVRATNGDPNGSAVITYSVSAFVNRRDAEASEDRLEWESIDAMLADIRQALEGPCLGIDGLASINYQGAQPIYSGGISEPCGIVVRYSVTTKQD